MRPCVHNIYQIMTNMVLVFQVWKLILIFLTFYCNDSHTQSVENESTGILPECVLGVENIEYILHNKDHPDGVIVDLNSTTIPLNMDLAMVFLVHGFNSETNASQYLDLTNTLDDKLNMNVFAVDWAEGACSLGGISITRLLSYPSAYQNAKVVGEYMADFIGHLISNYGTNLTNITLIGHSLGAQVVAYTARDLQKKKIGTVHHILALDPAGPGFEINPCNHRVCLTDADFVQVFHTSYIFGMHRAVGDVDFYFDGGYNQPGCPLLNDIACSHNKAIIYLTNILRYPECKFIGKKWDSLFPPENTCSEETCSIPGPLAAELPARGIFYVDTTSVPNFCIQGS